MHRQCNVPGVLEVRATRMQRRLGATSLQRGLGARGSRAWWCAGAVLVSTDTTEVFQTALESRLLSCLPVHVEFTNNGTLSVLTPSIFACHNTCSGRPLRTATTGNKSCLYIKGASTSRMPGRSYC